VPAVEVLIANGRVFDRIVDPNATDSIVEVIAAGEYYGMQTFDQALLKAVQAGLVDAETGYEIASSPHDFRLMLEAQGKSHSGIEHVMAAPEPEPEPEPDHAQAAYGSSYYGP
jgi:twitching motility protein PilT